MNFLLFDEPDRLSRFKPLTHTRPLGELRLGIFTLRERWQHLLMQPVSCLSHPAFEACYPVIRAPKTCIINSAVFPTPAVLENILQLKPNQTLVDKQGTWIASFWTSETTLPAQTEELIHGFECITYEQELICLQAPWHLFGLNDMAIRFDYSLITKGRSSESVNETNRVLGNQLFLEPGAKVNCAIINTETGPVYLAEGAEIMEGCMIRGPLVMGPGSVLKMGAKVYGACTLGEGSKVGGEINNVVFQANSNKAHDGFLGNAFIGEWCNLGADTNNSNLKNNYDEVRVWSEATETFVKTGLQFCGLIMGDHSKCGINTMLNTGTVIGVSCNVFGDGFPRQFIPSFSWGGAAGYSEYALAKALETARRVMARRNIALSAAQKNLLTWVFEQTQSQRRY